MKYEIFDANASLMNDYPEIEAKNSREAIQKYLDDKGEKTKFKRDGSKNTRFKTTPFEEINNVKYKKGRVVWYLEL